MMNLKTLHITATTFCLTFPFPQGQCLTMSVPLLIDANYPKNYPDMYKGRFAVFMFKKPVDLNTSYVFVMLF